MWGEMIRVHVVQARSLNSVPCERRKSIGKTWKAKNKISKLAGLHT
jgi:hypothetical protein